MNLDAKDIEAVAKSRVSRAEGNKTNVWVVICGFAIIAGAFVVRYSMGFGWVLSIVGLLAFVYYWSTLSKKQNTYKIQLLQEWEKEKTTKPQGA